MKGLMQQVPLTLDLVLRRCIELGGNKEVISVGPTGIVRSLWRDVGRRAAKVAGVLDELGVAPGRPVATFAWNSSRHVELQLGVPCAGRAVHPVNLRLSDDDIAYVINHVGDEVAFVDASVAPLVARLRSRLNIREYVILDDGSEIDSAFVASPRYEDLVESAADAKRPDLCEDDAAWICSTSATTGRPKLVMSSHRSVFLHTLGALMVDSHGISRDDTVMCATQMFHVAGWGTPYACAYAPAALVIPGHDTSTRTLAMLIESEGVTVGFGVPTIWTRLEEAYESGECDLSSLRTIQCGGAVSSRAMIDRYVGRGVRYVQSWGMTEMSPCGTSMHFRAGDGRKEAGMVASVGPPSPGVELRLVGEDGSRLPWDGRAVGELEARGSWVIRKYLDPEDNANESQFHEGWLRTGDLARVAPDGSVDIVDRAKDLIKSGGEWISSLDLERALAMHPDVSEAVVVAMPDSDWGERPAALVVPAPGCSPTPGELQAFLRSLVARWWIPEHIEIVDDVPRTGVGKYDKRALRVRLATQHTQRIGAT